MRKNKITYRNVESPIGKMIAGATEKGICFLEWHDRGGVDRIRHRVEKRYKMELVEANNKILDQLEAELERYFNANLKEFTVPIDITGTSFELETWKFLLTIPYGETRSYGQVARELGRPKAPRAVGRANGANYLSIVVPCHRVIETAGGLRGYGGGLWRKKHLLELENTDKTMKLAL